MPNFDAFERLMVESLTSAEQAPVKIAANARALAALPEASKPVFAHGRSATDLERWIARAYGALTRAAGSSNIVKASSNNQVGKDLIALPARTPIEIKSGLSGSKTDANLGLATIARAFGDPDDKTLAEIMRTPTIARRALWQQTHNESERLTLIEALKTDTMNALDRYFHRKLTVGREAPRSLTNLARAVAMGHSTGATIEAYARANPTPPLLLCADWSAGLVVYGQAFLATERVLVAEIKREAKRVGVHLRGERSGLKVLIYPNFKNSYHGPGPDGRIPAEAWVKGACFQVWVN